MKLGKLIFASLCVFSLCSFSTVAPVQVDAASCSTGINSDRSPRNSFNHVDQYEDRYEYLRGFKFGESGGAYLDVFDLCSSDVKLTVFQIGYMDGIKYYRYLNTKGHNGGGGNNNNNLLNKDDNSNTVLN